MPDPVYTGVIQDKGGAVCNVRGYGAVGDGKTDDTGAIRTAIAAVPDGGTLYIPTGTFRVTQTIDINRDISIEGSGPGSAIWLDLADPERTGVVIGLREPVAGGADSVAQNQSYRNFGIFGADGSCLYGLAVYNCSRSRFDNVHVRPGSSEHAIVIGGCFGTHFNFIVQKNIPYGYPPESGGWNGAGILVVGAGFPTPTSMPTNACSFDCIVEGGVGGGLAFQPQPVQGGDNAITGMYEGFTQPQGSVYGTGYGLLIEGCIGFTLYNLHVEASHNGTLITDSTTFTVRDSGFFSSALAKETLTVQNCSDFVIDRVLAGCLTIDAACSQYQVGNVGGGPKAPYSQPRVQNCFVTMFENPDTGGVIASSGMARFAAENLVPNGDLSRWPLGFAYMGVQPGLERTGLGAADPTCRFNPYAAKVTGAAASGGSTQAVLVVNVPNSTLYVGQPVTIWADIKRVSGAEISLGVYDAVLEESYLPATVPRTETAWVRVAVTYYPQDPQTTPHPWSIVISPGDDQAYEYYLGGVGALVGVAAPMGVQSAPASFPQGVQVLGKVISYGTAAPGAGDWQPGDIMYNAAPQPGGYVGWVCTAGGSPGTWNSFGAISA
ncbi:glycosyl hydrolase family 28-related protein [Longimicrobium sp.]|uniref:glycosyl hydrolase family 28-related protein n=1 Tax=Longimicrobium sp. TaxID=2029185 RepID=UPI003B3AE078